MIISLASFTLFPLKITRLIVRGKRIYNNTVNLLLVYYIPLHYVFNQRE